MLLLVLSARTTAILLQRAGDVVGNFQVGKQFDALVVNSAPLQVHSTASSSSSGFVAPSHGATATAATAIAVTASETPQLSMFPAHMGDDIQQLFEKFLLLGDDRHIISIYVDGVRVK
jgi:hypothetical protein